MSELNRSVDAGRSSVDSVGLNHAEGQVAESVDAEEGDSQESWKKELIQERQKAKEKARAAAKEAAELRAKLDQIEKAKAEEQGQYKELFQKRDSQYQELYNSWLQDKIQLSLSKALTQAGCVDPELAFVAGRSELLEFDKATGQVDGVDAWLQDVKERKPILFGQVKTPTINPSVPGGGARATSRLTGESTANMSVDEIKARLKALGNQMKG